MSHKDNPSFTVTIASGKGGTGKTTIATNLAHHLTLRGNDVTLLDCDVEEPNAHIFIKPAIENEETVKVVVPEWIKEKCTKCGKCGGVCEYKAIAFIGDRVLTFPEMCHSCLGCTLECPSDALKKSFRDIGVIQEGRRGNLRFICGLLNIGAINTPHLIKTVKKKASPNGITIIDAPPGCTCPTVEAIKNCDFVLLVTEPTPFGLNDLRLAVEMVEYLRIPFSVVINKSNTGNNQVKKYCFDENIDVLLEIPNKIEIAKLYSRGEMLLAHMPNFAGDFAKLFERITARIEK